MHLLFFCWQIAAVQEQRNPSVLGMDSMVGESSLHDPPIKDKTEQNFESLNLNNCQVPTEDETSDRVKPFIYSEVQIEEGIEVASSVEHQFLSSFSDRLPLHQNHHEDNPESKNLSALRNSINEDMSVSLQLGEPESKKRKRSLGE